MSSYNRFQISPGFLGLRSNKAVSGAAHSDKIRRLNTKGGEQTLAQRERLSFCEEDIVDIDPTGIPEALAVYRPRLNSQESTFHQVTGPSPSFFSKSRSSLSRIKNLSRKPKQLTGDTLVRPTQYSQDPTEEGGLGPFLDVALSHSPLYKPKTPSEDQSEGRWSLETAPVDDSSSIFYDSDPFRRVDSHSETHTSKSRPTSVLQVVQEEFTDPHQTTPSEPNSQSTTPTIVTPSVVLPDSPDNPLRRSFKRLRGITKGSFFSSHSSVPEVCQILPHPPPRLLPNREASSPQGYLLPELSFDDAPFSVPFDKGNFLEDFPGPPKTPCSSPRLISPANSTPDPPGLFFPNLKYDLVDPTDLTASPAATIESGYSAALTLLSPPSPSWLSRNVVQAENTVRHPPEPLPIQFQTSQLIESNRESGPVVLSSRSERSSLTLFTTDNRLLNSSLRSLHTPSVNRLSILRYRHSIAESRKSIQSFITCASLVFPEEADTPLGTAHTRPKFYLLLHPPSPKEEPQEITLHSATESLSPLEVLDSSNPLARLPSLSFKSFTGSAKLPCIPGQTYEIFIPPHDLSEPEDSILLPPHLLSLARNLVRTSVSSMSTYGNNNKQADNVDWGDEVDYADYEWFKDPPSKSEPAPPQPATEPYVPLPGVIERNDILDFALRSAPNVLYGRFKQYGQLGVLAWCHEFSEMIEAIKHLGLDGNMFVSTREQALKTCEEILRLDLDIEMQIIVIYLSSQVARLRRFLDHDGVWEDYPRPNFPQDDHIRIM